MHSDERNNNRIVVLLLVVIAFLAFLSFQVYQQGHTLLPDGSKPNPFADSR